MEVDLHVTNRCNLKCKHCVYTSGEWEMPDMTLDTVKNLIPSLKKLGVKEVHITGGEPLVKKEEILTLCRKHSDCIFVAFTNATLIDEEFAK